MGNAANLNTIPGSLAILLSPRGNLYYAALLTRATPENCGQFAKIIGLVRLRRAEQPLAVGTLAGTTCDGSPLERNDFPMVAVLHEFRERIAVCG